MYSKISFILKVNSVAAADVMKIHNRVICLCGNRHPQAV